MTCINRYSSNTDLNLRNLSQNKLSFAGNKEKEKAKYIICDNFDTLVMEIDNDGYADLSHGELVHKFAENRNSDNNIYDVRIKEGLDFDIDLKDFYKKLNKIAECIDKGENIKAVNMSFGADVNFADLRDLLNTPVNADNIEQHRETIYNKLISTISQDKNSKEAEKNVKGFIKAINGCSSEEVEDLEPESIKFFREEVEDVANMTRAIKKLTDKGTKVFIAAGNEGPEYMNLFALPEKTICVGALDPDGKVADYSATALVNKYERGKVCPKPKIDNGKITGFSIAGNDELDVPLEETSCSRFIGKDKDSIMADPKDYDLLKKLTQREFYSSNSDGFPSDTTVQCLVRRPEFCYQLNKKSVHKALQKVYSVEEMGKIFKIKPSVMDKVKNKGDYTDASFNLVFKADKDNKIELVGFNKKSEGDEGTSFASPWSMKEYSRNPDYLSPDYPDTRDIFKTAAEAKASNVVTRYYE